MVGAGEQKVASRVMALVALLVGQDIPKTQANIRDVVKCPVLRKYHPLSLVAQREAEAWVCSLSRL